MPIASINACSTTPLIARTHHPVHSLPPYVNLVKLTPFSPSRISSACAADAFRWRARASSSEVEGFDWNPARSVPSQPSLDNSLLMAEVICIVPSTVYSFACVATSVIPGASKQFQVHLGSKSFLVQYFLLVGAVAIGFLIRWRQWQRICTMEKDGVGVDLIGKIEKLEDDLKSSTTIIRALSRQLEKLGIKFRVTRKGLKEPLDQTTELAAKNSEAIRVLAMQEEILKKELGEIQKVLLAMQEQQQKQLELILAIGKAGRLLDSMDDLQEHGRISTGRPKPVQKEAKMPGIQFERHAGGDNHRPSTSHSGHQ
ncbi:uncharacterized protein LOC121975506 [Zingiber officinale]|uniref:Uncharacterized protein n=1 Tax=Zingiber officinale TaxID=94328 RepID=A0A8J5LE79_ZINOF|nr:uncharacterized protein LOC121975506 [Zingiber officinale]KAG6511032.1 hypothetical protein ZIOFF_029081 [Zingiber officinale]